MDGVNVYRHFLLKCTVIHSQAKNGLKYVYISFIQEKHEDPEILYFIRFKTF